MVSLRWVVCAVVTSCLGRGAGVAAAQTYIVGSDPGPGGWVSDTVVGALIAAAAATVGIWLQSLFERRARRREREYSLRRDVFLEALDDASANLTVMGSYLNAATPLDGSQPIRPGTKLALVASEESLEHVLEVSWSLGDAVMTILELRAAVEAVRLQARMTATERDGLTQARTLNLRAQAQAFDLLAEHIQVPGPAIEWLRQLRAELQDIDQGIREQENRIANLSVQEGEVLEALAREGSPILLRCSREVWEAALVLRQELELPINAEALSGKLREHERRSQERLQQALDHIRQLVNEAEP